ncbi:MAG TPA: type II secretion system F family protein [Candidatus Hydrogenedentes bacterium]|nr:type II secretion system F family protein [Candidatus Hydrogenedentota bacterium]
MPQYRYEVKKTPGETMTGVMEAESQRAAIARLRDMGYFPISIEEFTGDEKQDALRSALLRVKLQDRNVFFRQLANLNESGMPIMRALATLVDQTTNPKMKVVIEHLRNDILKGSTFAEALERHPKVFPAMYCNLIRAGETGGMLEEVMWRIVAFGDQEEELRGKAVSAMVYPAFLVCIGTIAVFILVSFVFPKFLVIFEEFNTRLPWPTRVVMGLCDFMGSYWWAVLGVAFGMGAGLYAYLRTDGGRRRRDEVALRMPVLRGVVVKYEMAKFARTLGTLLENGVPILNSLRVTEDTLSNRVIAEEVGTVLGRVTEGDSISESLQKCPHFPPMVISMFAVGEESGRLGAVTKRLADAYDNEVDRAVKAMAALLEPVLIVVMGVVIGFLVIAMLLPMLTLSSSASV